MDRFLLERIYDNYNVISYKNWESETGLPWITTGGNKKELLFKNFDSLMDALYGWHFSTIEEFHKYFENFCKLVSYSESDLTKWKLQSLFIDKCICTQKLVQYNCIIYDPQDSSTVYVIGSACIEHFNLKFVCSLCLKSLEKQPKKSFRGIALCHSCQYQTEKTRLTLTNESNKMFLECFDQYQNIYENFLETYPLYLIEDRLKIQTQQRAKPSIEQLFEKLCLICRRPIDDQYSVCWKCSGIKKCEQCHKGWCKKGFTTCYSCTHKG